jgi:hypothetical protein
MYVHSLSSAVVLVTSNTLTIHFIHDIYRLRSTQIMPIQRIDKLTASGFFGNVLEPDSECWTEATQAWGAQSKRSPKFVLQPQSAEDVSNAVCPYS